MGQKSKGPSETGAERAYADIGADQHKISKRLQPIRDDLFKRVSNFKQKRQQMKNLSSADAAKAYQAITQKPAATQTSQPGATAAAGLKRASGSAALDSNTDLRADQAHVKGLQSLTNTSLGQQSEAIQGMGDLAQRGLEESVTRARRDAAHSRFVGNTIGQVAGIAGAEYAGRRKTLDVTPPPSD